MPAFRCTSCQRRVESPVVIGAGDCPHCGGDVVYDIHRQSGPRGPVGEAGEPGEVAARVPLLRRILRR